MIQKIQDPRYQLHKISKLYIDDLLAMSDADILAEAAKELSGRNPGAMAKTSYQKALLCTGKNRLQAARLAIDMEHDRSAAIPNSINIDIMEARKILEKIAANDPEFCNRITLAARDLHDIPDSEVLSILLDLKLLGALPDDVEE